MPSRLATTDPTAGASACPIAAMLHTTIAMPNPMRVPSRSINRPAMRNPIA